MLSAVGFTLQWGVSNVINWAYVDFMTLVAFLDYTFTHYLHWNFWPAAILSVLLIGVLSLAMNQLLVQPFLKRGIKFFNMLIVTFGLGTIVQYLIEVIWGPTFFSITVGGQQPIHVVGVKLTVAQLIIIGVAAASMVGFHLLLTRTDLGKAMRAVSVDPSLAQVSGIRTNAVLNMAWFLSGVLCGMAGLVLAFNTASFDSTTGTVYILQILAVVVLGGIGSPYGAMGAALIIGLVGEWAALLINPYFNVVVSLLALIVVLLWRPQGLFRSLTSGSGGGTA
ncbi:branched-chain amino acid ABC transporter permease [Sulfobacillus sp. DSM 109850]|uniref:Branched-chain amino acid ABC transporter permease n=1 Tax=Sulfobacillus harzensis TaxID=2729629 RepID=A0A7Y0Q5C0_9FIRM|nr:branched-chain amino acid ABC transporter permease [Sulfobacillus harzensis]